MHVPGHYMEGIRKVYAEGYVTEKLQAIEAFDQVARCFQWDTPSEVLYQALRSRQSGPT